EGCGVHLSERSYKTDGRILKGKRAVSREDSQRSAAHFTVILNGAKDVEVVLEIFVAVMEVVFMGTMGLVNEETKMVQ
ncbi:hypothetical protein J0S82_010599, partial [Galemys pyrenaicus]